MAGGVEDERRAAVASAVEAVRARIAVAGGDPATVTIVAVTKGFDAGAVSAALAAGLADIGENYAQDLRAKAAALGATGEQARWHFLGRLQTNKVRLLAPLVSTWQSVDRPALVAELAQRATGAGVLVQVNVSDEAQKGGCAPGEAPALVHEAQASGLRVRGLMAVGATGPPEAARPGFRALADLADRLGLEERSMGMSGDLEVAVEEGSTMVRVGTALFGQRPK